MTSTTSSSTPAAKLIGLELPNGWRVISFADKKPNATGGFFSIGYVVEHTSGRTAFLKAIDFSDAFRSSDPSTELEKLTKTFNFERELLTRCRAKNTDHVVRALEDGSLVIDTLPVPYLIFEMADGDMRSHMDLAARFDLAWTLRMLHNVTVGLSQLHRLGIAHQDLKPSNILMFQGTIAKLADLGRSAHVDLKVPHDNATIPGAWPYAAPELRYGFVDPDYKVRRMGSDFFLLGNIILFAFTRQTVSSVLFSFLAEEHSPLKWHSRYLEVLPFLQSALTDALGYIQLYIPEQVRGEIISMLRQLCEPDVTKRGHPAALGGYSLERYVT